MLKIEVCYHGSSIKGFIVKGHADYAPEGQDIVCAGVSAITQTALIGLLKHLNDKPTYKIDKGNLEVFLADNTSDDDFDKAQIILSTMLAGLQSLQESYGEYVEVEIRRCKNV
ncbi:MAG: ribosomal-processing cysteine protease Prp [Syntrophomonadaceae bacterium]|nr:ribosomal-processing cysteine protease Prp [Syntrophomonadaceae bacterium]